MSSSSWAAVANAVVKGNMRRRDGAAAAPALGAEPNRPATVISIGIDEALSWWWDSLHLCGSPLSHMHFIILQTVPVFKPDFFVPE